MSQIIETALLMVSTGVLVFFLVHFVVRRMLSHARRDRSTLAGLRTGVENRSAHHRPRARPVREFIERRECAILPIAQAARQHEHNTQRR